MVPHNSCKINGSLVCQTGATFIHSDSSFGLVFCSQLWKWVVGSKALPLPPPQPGITGHQPNTIQRQNQQQDHYYIGTYDVVPAVNDLAIAVVFFMSDTYVLVPFVAKPDDHVLRLLSGQWTEFPLAQGQKRLWITRCETAGDNVVCFITVKYFRVESWHRCPVRVKLGSKRYIRLIILNDSLQCMYTVVINRLDTILKVTYLQRWEIWIDEVAHRHRPWNDEEQKRQVSKLNEWSPSFIVVAIVVVTNLLICAI